MSEKEIRMRVSTVDVCSCGLVMHQENTDDYATLGSDSGICCPDCGNEKFITVEQLKDEIERLRSRLRNARNELNTHAWSDKCQLKVKP